MGGEGIVLISLFRCSHAETFGDFCVKLEQGFLAGMSALNVNSGKHLLEVTCHWLWGEIIFKKKT